MNHLVICLVLLAYPGIIKGQDLQEFLEQQTKETTEITSATFKATRIMNGHSIERMPEGQLDFRISHRFGRVN